MGGSIDEICPGSSVRGLVRTPVLLADKNSPSPTALFVTLVRPTDCLPCIVLSTSNARSIDDCKELGRVVPCELGVV